MKKKKSKKINKFDIRPSDVVIKDSTGRVIDIESISVFLPNMPVRLVKDIDPSSELP